MLQKLMQYKIKGMSLDLATLIFNGEYSFENKNIRINTLGANTYLGLSNEQGNKELLDLKSHVGDEEKDNIHLNIYVLGTCLFSDFCIIFGTGIDLVNDIKKDYIWKFNSDLSIELIYNGNLSFDKDHNVKAIGLYENEKVQKIYWIDGINMPKVLLLPLKDENGTFDVTIKSVYDQKLDFVPKLKFLEEVLIEKTSGGVFASGVIQYVITYSDKYLLESNIWYVSPLFYNTLSNRGADAETDCNIAYRFRFVNLDTSYDYILIYAISRTSLEDTPVVYKLPNISTLTSTYIDTGSQQEAYDIRALINKQLSTFIPNCISSKDNTLFMGNYSIHTNDIKQDLEKAGLLDYVTNISNNLTPIYSDIDDSQRILDLSSYTIKTFRNNEWYRIGIQFQDEYGTPSNIVYLRDILMSMGNDPKSPEFKRKSILTVIPYSDSTGLNKFLSKYKRARLVMVNRTGLPHSTICQGVLCPTVFRLEDRFNNSPFAISSWAMRPLPWNLNKMNNGYYPIPESGNCMPLYSNMVPYLSEIQSLDDDQVKNSEATFWGKDETTVAITEAIPYYYYCSFYFILPGRWASTKTWPTWTYYYSLGRSTEPIESSKDVKEWLNKSSLADALLLASSAAGWENSIIGNDFKILGCPRTVAGLRMFLTAILTRKLSSKGIPNSGSVASSIVSGMRMGITDADVKEYCEGEKGNPAPTYNSNYPASIPLFILEQAEYTVTRYITYSIKDYNYHVIQKIAKTAGPVWMSDHNILTFHSPDIEKNLHLIDKNSNIKYRVVGYTSMEYSSFNLVLLGNLTSYAQEGKCGLQYVLSNFPEYKAGVYNVPLWSDTLDPAIVEKANIGSDRKLFPVYTWHRNNNLGGQSDNVVKVAKDTIINKWYGEYDRKIFANVHHCSIPVAFFNSNYNSWYSLTDATLAEKYTCNFHNLEEGKAKVIDNSFYGTNLNSMYFIGDRLGVFPPIASPRVFNSEEITSLKLDVLPEGNNLGNNLNYYGNLLLAHSVESFTLPLWEEQEGENDFVLNIIDSKKKNADSSLILYNSFPHVVLSMGYQTIDGKRCSPNLPLLHNSSAEGDRNTRIRDLSMGINASGESEIISSELGYLWETSKHQESMTSLCYKDGKSNSELPENILYIAELYQDLSAEDIYGDTREDTLFKHSWIPIGPWQTLEKKDVTLKGYGDTFIGRWDCLKTSYFSLDDIQSYNDITSLVLESDINVDARCDNYYRTNNASSINIEKYDILNDVYNLIDDVFSYKILKSSSLVNNFLNLICWSLVKVSGEETDTWSKIDVADCIDVQGEYGKLRSMANFLNNLYCFQDSAVYKLNYNSRVAISPTDGGPIELSTSYKVEPPLMIRSGCGINSGFAVLTTSTGLYFYDYYRRKIMMIDEKGTVVDLSTDKKIDSLVLNSKGFTRAHYDLNVKDIYFNFDDYSIAFNEEVGEFTSLYNYEEADIIFTLYENSYAVNGQSIWQQRAGKYNYFFGDFKPFYIHLLANSDPGTNKVFDAVEFSMSSTSLDAFDYMSVWNDYQRGGVSLELKNNKPAGLKRKFRIWRALIPRNNEGYPEAGINPTRDRIYNTWAMIKLTKDYLNESKYIMNNFNVTYF